MNRFQTILLGLVSCGYLTACGDDVQQSTDADVEVDADPGADADVTQDPNAYIFDSRFSPGTSPVSKSGQVFRHILIEEVKHYIGGLTADVDTNGSTAGDVKSTLEFYFNFDSSVGGTLEHNIATTPAPLQATFNDVSSDKNLVGKLAGNDSATDHKEWNTPGNMLGWSGDAGASPTALVQAWFQKLDDLAVARVASPELGPDGSPVPSVFLTAEGHDLQQLIQKFLLGAIGFSQGADDYLSDDVEGKGLLDSNLQSGDSPYSSLGHAWDEGFGYFGASIDYHDYTDEERAGSGGRADYSGGYHDLDGDGSIDLTSEYVLGNSSNCGKRDGASVEGSKTTFGDDAFAAFRDGRALILSVDGELSSAQLDELRAYRDAAVSNWEKCIAATVVHYINDTLGDMAKFGTEEYDFATHAKHWSELKGFALGLQFNPTSPLHQDTRFADLHGHIGEAPVLPNADGEDIAAYKVALESARTLMQDAYDFEEANVLAW